MTAWAIGASGVVMLLLDALLLDRSVKRALRAGVEWDGERPRGMLFFFLGLACIAAAWIVGAHQ